MKFVAALILLLSSIAEARMAKVTIKHSLAEALFIDYKCVDGTTPKPSHCEMDRNLLPPPPNVKLRFYLGPWVDGLPHGQGTTFTPDGKIFVGTYVAGHRNGPGYQEWKSGRIISYKGQWADDRPNGLGTMIFANGQTIEGMWKDGKAHGEATITYKNGDKREGTFVTHKRERDFILTKANGRRYLQVFEADKLVRTEEIQGN